MIAGPWPVIRYATVRGLSRLAGTEPHAARASNSRNFIVTQLVRPSDRDREAGRGCREVLDGVSAQDGSGKIRKVIEFRHSGVKSEEQFLLRALSRKSETS